ncbi:MAG: NAD(P)-dependent alcohol dehydrogenase [Pseudomonadota bacterium]
MKGLTFENDAFSFRDDLPKNKPDTGELLVKVVSAAVYQDDEAVARGDLEELAGRHTAPVRSGFDFAGIVEEPAEDFAKGDRVFGYVDIMNNAHWAHQEFVPIRPDCVARFPSNLSFAEAATIPMAGMTVLKGLRDVALAAPGETVLVIGGSGALGPLAIQFAKILELDVAAMAGPGKEALLTSLGASRVYDYRATKMADITESYDIILDLSTQYAFADIKHLLSENGRFVPANPFKFPEDLAPDSEAANHIRELLIVKGETADLDVMADWLQTGKVKTFVDSVFPAERFAEAFARLEERSHFVGRVILNFSDQS